ncbi:MAG: substrate-binding domain-containing protein [Clostridiales bacterium]|nr:substrate-binding domain-containing protein [Clostridiales bacterium]
MKRKVMAMLMSAAMVLSLGTVAFAEEETEAAEVTTEAEATDDAATSDLIDATVETKVALITMDQMDVHWVRLEAAAEERVAAYNEAGSNIELTWLAPETKDNAQQIQKIEAAIADGVNYIIIACNDATSCNMALQEALDAGIQIIYVDSPADLEGSATYATDNYQGGVVAGEYMLQVLTDAGITEGTIGIVDAQAGVDSCQNRYDGFASVFEGTDFELGERQYSDGDNSKAQELANTLIANGVVAIYGTNDGATNGAAAAVADAASNGTTVYCVGWDKSDSNIAHVESGELLAFMAQNPNIMGIDAIDAVVRLENGEDLGGEVVDTGVSTVTIDNVADFKD